MKYLLYCVFRSVPQPELEALTGVEGKPVLVVDHGGLGAAISELGQPDSLPDVEAVLAYESVVEFFFSRRTVIPMRYGCAVRDRAELAAMLDEHHQKCDALLDGLEGLTEMGIQVPANVSANGSDAGPAIDAAAVSPARFPDSNRSGVSYLLAKKQYYGSADRMAERQNELVNTLCQPLSGLFVRRKVELPSRGEPLLSLYFLVPRPSVESFREASRRCLKDGPAEPVVSGPWPPYNFVDFSNINGIS
ncbi:MAG: GvpL/GvpF family gas vesicle protein [Candidatus Korobacteraceae bacterium]